MISFYVAATIVILFGVALGHLIGDVPAMRHAMLLLVPLIFVIATWVQFRERCPRCNVRLGHQARPLLPATCKVCGVPFLRP